MFATQVDFEMKGDTLQVPSFFKNLVGYFSWNGSLQGEIKIRVGEKLQAFGRAKNIC